MLTNLKLTNFRIHKSTEIDFNNNNFVALVGKNDIGKSSVLEALDILCNSGKTILENDKTNGSTVSTNIVGVFDNDTTLDYLSPTIEIDRKKIEILFNKFDINNDNHFSKFLEQDLNFLIFFCNQASRQFIETTYSYHFERNKVNDLLNIFISLNDLNIATTSQALKEYINDFMNGNRDLQKLIAKKERLYNLCTNYAEQKIINNIFNILSQFDTDLSNVIATILNCDGLTNKAKQLIKEFNDTGDSTLIHQIENITFNKYKNDMESFISLMEKPYYITLTPYENPHIQHNVSSDKLDPKEAWDDFKDTIENTFLNGGNVINDIPFFMQNENRDLEDLIFEGSLQDIVNKSDEILTRFEDYTSNQKKNDIVYLWERTLNSFGSNDIILSKRGSGFKRLCEIYAFTMRSLKNISSYHYGRRFINILAVEEPEISLHPSQQRDIVQRLRDITNIPDTQVIITTHSPYIVNELEKENVCILKRKFKEENGHIIRDANGLPIELDEITTKALDKRIINYPSMAEINYLAFDEPSITYHQELYGQIEVECLGESNGCKINQIINAIWRDRNNVLNDLITDFNRQPDKPFEVLYDNNLYSSPDGNIPNRDVLVVPYCVRNAIDHPGDMNKQWKNNISVVDLSIKMLIEIYKAVEKAEDKFLSTINSQTGLDSYGREKLKFKCSGTSDTNEHSLVYWVKYQIDHPNECLRRQKNGTDITHGEIKNKINFVKAMYDIDPDWLNK